MDDIDKIYFSEELYQISVNLASMVSHEKTYFSGELQQMSANLASMVAHLDTKSPEFEPRNIKETAEETYLLKNLLTAATDAEVAWKQIREMIETFSEHKEDTASQFLKFSDGVMFHEPMIKGLPWHLYAQNPTLSIRLSFISMSPVFKMVVSEMKRNNPWSYGWFEDAVYKYILAYEVHRRYITKYDLT
jgi:hypothetical protein